MINIFFLCVIRMKMPNEDYADDDDGRNLLYLFADLFIEDYKSFKYVCNL